MYEGPGVYQNHKGNFYHVIGLAKHSEESTVMVLYTPLYLTESGVQLTVRPLHLFNTKVKLALGTTIPRYRLIRPEK